jgi:single-strand DNA-binding protein
MAGLNKTLTIGRLGQDPEVKYSQSGMAVCNFSVATSEERTDKNTGEKQEKTEWHKIVCFGKLAENCGKYLSKGRQCYVEGKLQTSSYEKDGQTHYATKIIADVVQFLDSAEKKSDTGNSGYTPPPKQQPQPQQSAQRQIPSNTNDYVSDSANDGEIPF